MKTIFDRQKEFNDSYGKLQKKKKINASCFSKFFWVVFSVSLKTYISMRKLSSYNHNFLINAVKSET